VLLTQIHFKFSMKFFSIEYWLKDALGFVFFNIIHYTPVCREINIYTPAAANICHNRLFSLPKLPDGRLMVFALVGHLHPNLLDQK